MRLQGYTHLENRCLEQLFENCLYQYASISFQTQQALGLQFVSAEQLCWKQEHSERTGSAGNTIWASWGKSYNPTHLVPDQIWFGLNFGQEWCSGPSPDSVLKDHSWWCWWGPHAILGDWTWVSHAQDRHILYYHSGLTIYFFVLLEWVCTYWVMFRAYSWL